MSLKADILSRLDDDSLYRLKEEYPSLLIDEEWNRRLSSCNPDLYIPTLEILKQHNFQISKSISNGLSNLGKCFPWRIGIIYDYISGQIKSIHVGIGNLGKYKYKGRGIIFTWLYSNKNHLMLREIISNNSNSLGKNLSYKLDKEYSENISKLLLENKTVTIKYVAISGENKLIRSFQNRLSNYERFEIFPYSINNIPLIELDNPINPNIVGNVPVIHSSDVSLFLDVSS